MKLRIVEVLPILLLLTAAPLWADPITLRQITGGQYNTNSTTGTFEITGDGFDLTGRMDVRVGQCQPCSAGQSVSFFAFGELRSLSGTVDGVDYPSLFVADSFNGIPSVFNVRSTGSVIIPFDATTGTQLTFPFATVEGARFIAYTDSAKTNPAFDFPAAGSGTGVVTLHLDDVIAGKPVFTGTQITWDFGTSTVLTPEPASVLLLGTGLAAVLVNRLRSARAKKRP